ELDLKLGGIIEIYEKFVGEDPRKVPMKIFPAVHYSMGGLWVDFDQMTNIPGIFAAGECDYSQHGGNRLGANRSEEHTSELQSRFDLVCRLLLEKKKKLLNNDIHSTNNAHFTKI